MNLIDSLSELPWKGHADEVEAAAAHPGNSGLAAQRVALRFFLGVVAILFALFVTAYFVRMELNDWRPMPEPPLLWFNTLLLFLSSAALQWTRQNLAPGRIARVRAGLLAGGLLTAAFVAGQLIVWREMTGSGYLIYTNPANSFFYVLTGLHALHVLGGLWVWLRAGAKVWFGTPVEDVRLSVELCSVYWHFLLLVWLAVFALLSYT